MIVNRIKDWSYGNKEYETTSWGPFKVIKTTIKFIIAFSIAIEVEIKRECCNISFMKSISVVKGYRPDESWINRNVCPTRLKGNIVPDHSSLKYFTLITTVKVMLVLISGIFDKLILVGYQGPSFLEQFVKGQSSIPADDSTPKLWQERKQKAYTIKI